jgi:FemAB-related protein (PEP-CTERM system-associated)
MGTASLQNQLEDCSQATFKLMRFGYSRSMKSIRHLAEQMVESLAWNAKMASPRLEPLSQSIAEPRRVIAPATVRSFSLEVAERWDRFVLEQPSASFFHMVGWRRVVERTFGYEACYFYAERDGRITGVAPLFAISNWVVGKCLLSVPFGVYGGVCAADAESEQALLDHLKGLAVSQDVDFLELRNRNRATAPGFHPNRRYATFHSPLFEDPALNLKRLPKDTRYMIRKSQKAGLRAQEGLKQQLDAFYRLFAWNFWNLGTPVFPRDLLENLVQEFPGRVHLLLVYSGAQPVSGVFSLLFRDTILPYYAGTSPEANGLAANNFMYWELMQAAAESGIRCFDFGRSKVGTGAYAFKTQWNMTVEALDYQVFLVKRETPPDFSPLNPKFDLAARVWKRLPLPLATWLGPHVVRWFP